MFNLKSLIPIYSCLLGNIEKCADVSLYLYTTIRSLDNVNLGILKLLNPHYYLCDCS